MCGTGKVLDIDGSFNAGGETPVLAKDPNGEESQKFYPLKIISPMIPDKEFSFIGRLAEKDQKGDGKVFFNILEDGTACLKPIDAYLLHAKNKQNTIDMCWNFAYRQIEAKEEEIKSVKKETNEEEKVSIK